MNVHQLVTLYHALIEPHLTYGIIAWGGVTNNHLIHLEKAQKWILKVIHNLPLRYPTESLFHETKIFDIRQLFCYTILTYQHANRSELINIEHNYDTRYKEYTVKIPKTGRTISQRGFHFLGPKIYNRLPPDIKLINSNALFKKRVRKWISAKNRLEIHSLIDMKNIYYNTQ